MLNGYKYYELEKPFPKRKNKNVIELMKNELGGKIKKWFAALRAKTYSYLTDNNNEDKKARDIKKCVIKGKFKLINCKSYLEATRPAEKINQLEKNKVNKIKLKNSLRKKQRIYKKQ